jgi:hypothetical protein
VSVPSVSGGSGPATSAGRTVHPLSATAAVPGSPRQAALVAHDAALPLGFEPNRGQADRRILFLAHAGTSTVLLTADAAVLGAAAPAPAAGCTRDTRPGPAGATTVYLRLIGANPHPRVVALDRLPGTTTYLLGATPRAWHTHIPTFARVAYHDVYPGVDLIYRGTPQGLAYDFVLAPYAHPSAVRLSVSGAPQPRRAGCGRVRRGSAVLPLRQESPAIYQDVGGRRRRIGGQTARLDRRTIGFEVGAYDRRHPLVIAARLAYATVFGRGGSVGMAIAVDQAGNAYVAGSAAPGTVPTTSGTIQPKAGGASLPGGGDAFIAKLNPQGGLVWATYLGGSGDDGASGLALGRAGDVYVTGATSSRDFPVTAHAPQRRYGGAGPASDGGGDAFVAHLDATGSALLYSTYLGGASSEQSGAIAVDSSGAAVVTGATTSPDFPTTPGAAQRTFRHMVCSSTSGMACSHAYVARLNPAGSALVYSTYLGGSGLDMGRGIAVDAAGNAYVTGMTASKDFPVSAHAFQRADRARGTAAFVTKLTPSGRLVYSTYLGGSHNEAGLGIAVGAAGNAYVTGMTSSKDFPATAHALRRTPSGPVDAFVARLSAAGDRLVYGTYLGGSGYDVGSGIAVVSSGAAYVTGATASGDFPTARPGAGGTGSTGTRMLFTAFVATLNPSGSALLLSTRLGGHRLATGDFGDWGNGVAVDPGANVYVTGSATTTDFPRTWTLPGTHGPDNSRLYVVKLAPAGTGSG